MTSGNGSRVTSDLGSVAGAQFYCAPRSSGYIEQPPHCAPQMTSSSFPVRARRAQGSLGFLVARYESKPGTPPRGEAVLSEIAQ